MNIFEKLNPYNDEELAKMGNKEIIFHAIGWLVVIGMVIYLCLWKITHVTV
jgi:uncharacterized membrane protein YjfL (UPF0719 family)